MRILCFLFFIFIWGAVQNAKAGTLDDVWERGILNCGVDEQHYGFAYLDERGDWRGFEVDLCRALASVVLGDQTKTSFVPLNAQTRFGALKSRDVDVLLRSTTWTYTRDTVFDYDFPTVTFYDQLGVMAHKSIGVEALEDVKEGTVCVAAGTTTLETIRNYVQSTGKPLRIKMFNSREGLNNFFFSGQCNLYAADLSALSAILSVSAPNPDDYIFLETSISKEPLGPVVRSNDREWYEIVKWSIFGLLAAEEYKITQHNVDDMKHSKDMSIRFMLGVTPGIGRPLRLSDTWMYDMIKSVGNYAEVYRRNLGVDSPLKMKRGLNALWKDGGLMYPMPMR